MDCVLIAAIFPDSYPLLPQSSHWFYRRRCSSFSLLPQSFRVRSSSRSFSLACPCLLVVGGLQVVVPTGSFPILGPFVHPPVRLLRSSSRCRFLLWRTDRRPLLLLFLSVHPLLFADVSPLCLCAFSICLGAASPFFSCCPLVLLVPLVFPSFDLRRSNRMLPRLRWSGSISSTPPIHFIVSW